MTSPTLPSRSELYMYIEDTSITWTPHHEYLPTTLFPTLQSTDYQLPTNKPHQNNAKIHRLRLLSLSSDSEDDEEEEDIALDEEFESNTIELINETLGGSPHQVDQEFKVWFKDFMKNEANSILFDGFMSTMGKKSQLYKLAEGNRFQGVTSSVLDFMYTILEDEDTSFTSVQHAFSTMKQAIFDEEEESNFRKFPNLPLEIQNLELCAQAFADCTAIIRKYIRGRYYDFEGLVPRLFERKHINYKIDTLWLDYNLTTVHRHRETVDDEDMIIDPHLKLVKPTPSYEQIRRLAIPAESIEWYDHNNDLPDLLWTPNSIAKFSNLKRLALLLPAKTSIWSDAVFVKHQPTTVASEFIESHGPNSLGFNLPEHLELRGLTVDFSLKINNTLKDPAKLVNKLFRHAINFFETDKKRTVPSE
ncbi:hypothetical protein EAF04_003390 [Stromatinia cepivora]|nr:hypothetical protein EAF04_003390 [Stromatinia cepivora]